MFSQKEEGTHQVTEGAGLDLDEPLSCYKCDPINHSSATILQPEILPVEPLAVPITQERQRERFGTTGQGRASRPTSITELLPTEFSFQQPAAKKVAWHTDGPGAGSAGESG